MLIHYVNTRYEIRLKYVEEYELSTKELVLLEALKLFLKKGFTDVSINEIAQNTGIAKASLFHHFKNKEVLLTSVIEKYFFSFLDRLNAEIYHMKGDVKDKLYYLFMSLNNKEQEFRVIINDNDIEFKSFFFLLMEGLKKFTHFSEYYKKYHDKRIHLIKSLLNEGKKNGEIISEIDVNKTTAFVDTVFNGLIMTAIISEKDKKKDTFQFIFEIIWDQIKVKKQS